MKTLSFIVFVIYFLATGYVVSAKETLDPKHGIHFKETLAMKDVSGECAYAIYLAIKNHNDYYYKSKIKMVIGRDVFISGAFCDLAKNDVSPKFVALLLSADKDGKQPLPDGQIITYFDGNLKIQEWGH